jgi:hypothetical protein
MTLAMEKDHPVVTSQAISATETIDPAGAQQDKSRAVSPAVLQEVHRAEEVVFDQLAGIRTIVEAGQHTRIRRGIDHPVGRAKASISLAQRISP